jgi:hypothetical protein
MAITTYITHAELRQYEWQALYKKRLEIFRQGMCKPKPYKDPAWRPQKDESPQRPEEAAKQKN